MVVAALRRLLVVWLVVGACGVPTRLAATAALLPEPTPPRLWLRAESLIGWSQPARLRVPLVTQNDDPASFSFLDDPGTVVVIGAGSRNDTFDWGAGSGVQVQLGGWLNKADSLGFELSGFYLPRTQKTFRASSLNDSVASQNIAFFATEASTFCSAGSECVLVNNRPNTARVGASQQIDSLGLAGLFREIKGTRLPVVIAAGVRMLDVDERFTLNDALINSPPTVVNVRDRFRATNRFWGMQLGAKTHWQTTRVLFDVIGTVALGQNQQTLSIRGQTNLDDTQVLQNFGLFSQPSNLGQYKKRVFAVLPSLRLKASLRLNMPLRPYIAYEVWYLHRVIRASEQVDRAINLTQNPLIGGTGVLAGPPRPLPLFKQTGLWLQGVGVGVEL